MRLNISQNILEDFIRTQPNPLEDDNFNLWKSFFDFMKGGGDVNIDIKDRSQELGAILNLLTSGRKGTKLTEGKTPKSHNSSFPKKINSDSIIFDNYDENIHELLEKKNKLVLGHKAIYLSQWAKVIGNKFESPLSFRKKKCDFNSWNFLNELIPFSSDIIISDRFIINDTSLIPSNLMEILKNIKGNYKGISNLLLITDKKESSLSYEEMDNLLKENNLGFNLSIVYNASYEWKEHDRNIITNHIRLKSGDTFNYFNSAGKLISKGTELDWYPLTTHSNVISTNIILSEIKKIIEVNSEDDKFGDFKNDLISIDS